MLQDRLDTLSHVRNAGISVCAGGIIGLGEGPKDRVGLIHQLATLPEHPESVPINALVSVAGTPLEGQTPPSGIDMVRYASLQQPASTSATKSTRWLLLLIIRALRLIQLESPIRQLLFHAPLSNHMHACMHEALHAWLQVYSHSPHYDAAVSGATQRWTDVSVSVRPGLSLIH